jgi:hypothetical protein
MELILFGLCSIAMLYLGNTDGVVDLVETYEPSTYPSALACEHACMEKIESFLFYCPEYGIIDEFEYDAGTNSAFVITNTNKLLEISMSNFDSNRFDIYDHT